jgi:hypothetical protein
MDDSIIFFIIAQSIYDICMVVIGVILYCKDEPKCSSRDYKKTHSESEVWN